MASEIKYFNFPIVLLKDFLINSDKCLNDILHYALYAHFLKLENGVLVKRMNDSAEYFNVQLGSVKHVIESGKTLHDSIDSKCPKVGITTTTYWDYRTNKKEEFDKVCLIAFLALKSIVQNKSYCKLDNRYWLARMDGKPASCEFYELSNNLVKYANEYQTKKIKSALRDGWGLVTYSRYTRGFYVSFSL